MSKTLFLQYATLKNQIKILEREMTQLQPAVMEAMEGNDEVEVKEIGTFIIGHRRAWVYPEPLERAKANLKEAEKNAQRLGEATYTENPYLLFKPLGAVDYQNN